MCLSDKSRMGTVSRVIKTVFRAFPLVGLALLLACSQGNKVDFAAANAAKGYYDVLLEGHPEKFVEGMNMPERIPDSYRSQLVANAKMFIGQQNAEHHGIKKVEVVNCVNDSAGMVAEAFLLLCFGDSTVEEVVVPMVKRDGKWLMK